MSHPSPISPALTSPTPIDLWEIAKFDAEAESWWDPNGSSRWLHKYNPVRVDYICDAACRFLGRDRTGASLRGLRILDIGCGAGVLCESLARLGAKVVGVEPGATLIDLASRRARDSGLNIDYRCATAESLVRSAERFDLVLAMEVIEHVADPRDFLRVCSELTKPSGLAILSTINRTALSFLFAIAIGEYLLRLLPPRTHRWTRFVRPAEMSQAFQEHGLATIDVRGVTMNLRTAALQLASNIQVNYLLTAQRPANG